MDIEAALQVVRSEVNELGLGADSEISDDADLLELGVDSLQMIQLLMGIEEACGVRLNVGDLFVKPTIRAIAAAILASAARGSAQHG